MTDARYITQLANDGDIQGRVAAIAANLGERDPQGFASAHRWEVAAYGDGNDALAAVYAYGEQTKTINVNQATGQRTDVIRDDQLLDAILAIRNRLAAEQQTPPE